MNENKPTPQEASVASVLFFDPAITDTLSVPEFRALVERVVAGLERSGWSFDA